MPASRGYRKTGFVCGLQREARCLAAAGLEHRIALSGARPERARAVARELLSGGAEALVSIGLAGGLDPRLGPGAVVVADRILSWRQPFQAQKRRAAWHGLGDMVRFRAPAPAAEKRARQPADPEMLFDTDPELRARLLGLLGDKVWSGTIVGVERAVGTPEDKLGLFAQTAALACDMESHAVAEAARDAGIPFLALRVVSDPSNRSIPEAALAGLTAAGGVSAGRVLLAVSLRPWELFELLSLALDARVACAALRRVARRGAPLFGVPG